MVDGGDFRCLVRLYGTINGWLYISIASYSSPMKIVASYCSDIVCRGKFNGTCKGLVCIPLLDPPHPLGMDHRLWITDYGSQATWDVSSIRRLLKVLISGLLYAGDFRFRNCIVDSIAALDLTTYLDGTSTLHTLNLSGCELVDGATSMSLFKGLRINRSLSELNLSSANLNTQSMKVIYLLSGLSVRVTAWLLYSSLVLCGWYPWHNHQ